MNPPSQHAFAPAGQGPNAPDYASEVGTLVRAQVLQKAAIFPVMTARKLSAQNAMALLG